MAKLFISNAGKVGRLTVGGLPAIVMVAGFSPTAAIITNVGIGQGSNVQIQPSLGASLYVYSFGDAMGSIRLGGMSFIAEVCSESGSGGIQGDGVKELMEFYSANRVSRSLKHINVTIGATVFSGFLVKMQLQIQDPENRFFTWTMDIAAIPNFAGLAAGARSSSSSTGETKNEATNASTGPSTSMSEYSGTSGQATFQEQATTTSIGGTIGATFSNASGSQLSGNLKQATY